jgi:hypothetical protein
MGPLASEARNAPKPCLRSFAMESLEDGASYIRTSMRGCTAAKSLGFALPSAPK